MTNSHCPKNLLASSSNASLTRISPSPMCFFKLLSISCLRWCWWCCCWCWWWWWRRRRRVFIFSTGPLQFPTSSQGRTDARYLEKFAGCLAVPPWGFPMFPSDKSGTSAGELLEKPMVRLKGWNGESWYTSLFHHAGYCLRLENSYLPFAINLPGIDIDWCSTYLLNDPLCQCECDEEMCNHILKAWQLGAGEPGFLGFTAAKRLQTKWEVAVTVVLTISTIMVS